MCVPNMIDSIRLHNIHSTEIYVNCDLSKCENLYHRWQPATLHQLWQSQNELYGFGYGICSRADKQGQHQSCAGVGYEKNSTSEHEIFTIRLYFESWKLHVTELYSWNWLFQPLKHQAQNIPTLVQEIRICYAFGKKLQHASIDKLRTKIP